MLQLGRSKVLRSWKEMDARVTHNLAEAKDNVKFVYAIEEYCHPLYLNDPVSVHRLKEEEEKLELDILAPSDELLCF